MLMSARVRQHAVLLVREGITPCSSQMHLPADVCPMGQKHAVPACEVRNGPWPCQQVAEWVDTAGKYFPASIRKCYLGSRNAFRS